MIEEIEGRGVGNLIQFYGGRLRVDILAQLYSIIDRRFFINISYFFSYTYFEKCCRKKHGTRPKIGLGIHWILYPGLEEMYKFVFAGQEFVSPLNRNLSEALLLLSHVFEFRKILLKFSVAKRTFRVLLSSFV